jgi:hypothetical protein
VKKGANFQDRNRIRQLEQRGYDAAEISVATNIEQWCVENFMKHPGENELPEGAESSGGDE